jgi:hypothetical protein
MVKVKDKAIPVQAWAGPEGSRRLGSYISRQSAHEGGQPYTMATFTPQEIFLILIFVTA